MTCLRTNAGSGRKATMDGVLFRNLQLTSDIVVESTSSSSPASAGVIYRVNDLSSSHNGFTGYYALLQVRAQRVDLGRGDNGQYTRLAETPAPIQLNRSYQLQVLSQGCNHQVRLDGVLMIDIDDCTYAGPGAIGVRAFEAEVRWYNLHALEVE